MVAKEGSSTKPRIRTEGVLGCFGATAVVFRSKMFGKLSDAGSALGCSSF